MQRDRLSCAARMLGAALAAAGATAGLRAGGTPENALVVIDPARADAKYVANYYLYHRDIPTGNVQYIDPAASSFQAFRDVQIEALLGELAHRSIRDHIDYIVVAPASSYYVPAAGLVSDGCSPVTRFALSSVYFQTFVADDVLPGGRNIMWSNRYWKNNDEALAFDSSISWKNGVPSNDDGAKYMFLGAALGYTGTRGNTVDEILTLIDNSIAADGTLATQTFYYMETSDNIRSDPRDGFFDAAVSSIAGLGGAAEHQFGVLPTGRHDCIGIMTGYASPGIESADMTVLPGAFCDHLTSFAATFSDSSQEKVSSWVRIGASGSWGTVEEPCNYPGKFPHARLHVYYFQGLSLGEACYRSVQYTPFQGLLYGDPLTRPFSHIPDVSVDDAPPGEVSGWIELTPEATTTHPTAAIESFELLIDGVSQDAVLPGDAFLLDTTALADGWHDLRVLAYDDTPVRSVGRWIGGLTVNNRGRSASIQADVTSGDLAQQFSLTVSGGGGAVAEVRVIQNGRVVAAEESAAAALVVHGTALGAGPVRVQGEALFEDGERVRSAPQLLTIAYSNGSPTGQPATAYGYTRTIRSTDAALVELPATIDDNAAALTYNVLTSPVQATILGGGPGNAYRLIRAAPTAEGVDTLSFQVSSGAGSSGVATITLVYDLCNADLNGDRLIDLADLSALLLNFGSAGLGHDDGDLDGDTDVDLNDLSMLLVDFGGACD